jgi:DNA-binding beta-propeller fold protein YncE
MALGIRQVIHLSPEGRVLDRFGKLGTGPNDIYEGWGTALDSQGNVALCHRQRDEITDEDRESIKVFSPQGRLVREILTPPSGAAEGCYGVHVDPQGRLFAVYNSSNRLRVFDSQGKLLSTLWGTSGSGPGEFYGLRDIALDTRRGLLYASDQGNSRVQQFSYDPGATDAVTVTHRLSFGTYGPEPGQMAYPHYLAVDETTGQLAVGDMANRRVQIFDSEGRFVRELRPQEVDDWQVMGLAFEPDGALVAADALNGAIWIFETDGRVRRTIEVPS